MDRTGAAIHELFAIIDKSCFAQSEGPAPSATRIDEQLSSVLTELRTDISESESLVTALFTIGSILTGPALGIIRDPAILNSIRDAIIDIDASKQYFDRLGASFLSEATARHRSGLVEVRDAITDRIAQVSPPAANSPYLVRSLSTGFELRGRTNDVGEWQSVMPPNQLFSVQLYDIGNDRTSTRFLFGGDVGRSGVGVHVVAGESRVDFDGDGLSDAAETIIGTNPELADTDRDGISDLAEIEQGLAPLGGRTFPTGVVASLPLSGESQQVVLEGSTLDGDRQTAYVATGSYGLAVVDASQFDNPIILGQLDLPGDSTDIAIDPRTNIVVLAANDGGIHFVDVSDEMLPKLIRTVEVSASRIEVVEGVAFVAVAGSLRAYDVLTGELQQSIDTVNRITDLALEGFYLYAMDEGARLSVIDISGPEMIVIDALQMPAGGGKLFVGDGVAYAAAASNVRGGYATAAVGDPDDLRILSGSDVSSPFIAPRSSVVSNGAGIGVIIGSPGGTHVVDVIGMSDPAKTDVAESEFRTRFELSAAPTSVSLAAGIGFVTSGAAGLQVINYLPFDANRQAPAATLLIGEIDVDPEAPGIQVAEGTIVPIGARVMDDVQVRNVELLVNGEVVRNDLSFPFDLSLAVPRLSDAENELRVQVQATDTGGNSVISEEVVWNVVPDSISPRIIRMLPADGSSRFEGHQTVRIVFSEPMDLATLTDGNFSLSTSDEPDKEVPTIDLQLRRGGREIQLTFDRLAIGEYFFSVDGPSVTDIAGNPVGTGISTASLSIIEDKDSGDSIRAALDLSVLDSQRFIEEQYGVDELGNPDPADVYRFEVTQATAVTAALSGRTDGAQIWLLADKDGDEVHDDADTLAYAGAFGSNDLTVAEDLSPGVYYVRIGPWNNDDGSRYTLTITPEVLPAQPLDPGNSLPTALNIGELTTERVFQDIYTHGVDGVDGYRFEVTQATAVTAALSGRTDGAQIWLLADKDGDEVHDDADTLAYAGAFGSNDLTVAEDLSPGVYYVRIGPWNNDDGSRYTLTITPEVLPAQPLDPGNSLPTALNIGELTTERVFQDIYTHGVDGVDGYRFEVTQATAVTAALSGRTDGAQIWLLADKDGDEVHDDADTLAYAGAFGSNDLTVAEDLSPGVYYVRIGPWNNDDGSRYTLTITPEVLPAQPLDPGNSLPTALNIGELTTERVFQDIYTHGVDGVDGYRFEVTQATAVTAALSGRTDGAQIWLLADKDGDEVHDDADTLAYAGAFGSNDLTVAEDLSPGVYYVRIGPWNNDDGSRYTLTITPEVLPAQPLDPGNSLPTALNIGELTTERVFQDIYTHGVDGVDGYRFEVTQATAVTAALSGRTDGAQIWLLADKDGDEVHDDADTLAYAGAFGSNDLTVAEDLSPGVYYVRIGPWNNDDGSRYTLTITPEVLRA